MPGIDAVLNTAPLPGESLYDFQLDENGDILTEDQLETAILLSLLSDRRAEAHQVQQPERRRGWIGDLETPNDPIGSTLWLLEQRRLTLSVALEAADAAKVACSWLREDEIAISVGSRGFIDRTALRLIVDLTKPNSKSESVLVRLWENTGRG